jgi:hypothetical protein
MPQYAYPITTDGVLVSVVVGFDQSAVASLVAANAKVPTPLHGTGIIDTGSNVTCVASHLVHQFQIVPGTGFQTVTPSSQAQVRLFRISLSILPPPQVNGPLLTEPALIAMELPQVIPNIDVIIGRDFLDRYEFHYDGPKQQARILF